jgi:hypothetical protein
MQTSGHSCAFFYWRIQLNLASGRERTNMILISIRVASIRKRESLATRLLAGQSGVRIPAEPRHFSLLQSVQTGSEPHTAPYLNGTGVLSKGWIQGCTNPGCQPSVATEFCKVAFNICGLFRILNLKDSMRSFGDATLNWKRSKKVLVLRHS